MNIVYETMRKSNNVAIFGDLKCCNEIPCFILTPPFLNQKPSVGMRCEECGKERRMFLTKKLVYEFQDPVLLEAIAILKNKWNNDE